MRSHNRLRAVLAIASVLGSVAQPIAPATAAQRPDLIVSRVSNPPDSVGAGQSFVVRSTTKNRGLAKAGPSTTRFYLSRDRVKSLSDKRLTGSRSIPALRRGASARGMTTVGVPTATPKLAHFVLACADDRKKVRESREGNNCRSSSEKVLILDVTAPVPPELTGTSPASPSDDLTPLVLGTAEAGSTVDLFTTTDCSGVPAGTGSAGSNGMFAIEVTVGNGTTTTFNGTATDSSENDSGCSSTNATYVHDPAPLPPYISEYVEGSFSNQAIEIYNPDTATLDLTGYVVRIYANASVTPTDTIALSGTLSAGDLFVIARSSSTSTIPAGMVDMTSSSLNFNGDDAVLLEYNPGSGFVTIDAIGVVGDDPGSEWGTGLTSTADNTLRRRLSVTQGDTSPFDAFDPSAEWDGYATDTFDGLGTR